jgi:CheY-like chemotaxis protein
MTRLLTRRGHLVTTADGVVAALRRLADGEFDLVISDIGLPDGTGLDLMQEICALGPIPGVALSGYGMEDDIRRSVEAGFTAHLTKPIDLAALESTIQRTMSQWKKQSSTADGARASRGRDRKLRG